MYEAHVTTGNRVTVPRAVREAMGMKPGDVVGFIPSGSGFALQVVGSKKRKVSAKRDALACRR